MRIRLALAAVITGTLTPGLLHGTSAPGQSAAGAQAPAAFTTVSIRPNTYGDPIHSTGLLPGGRFLATNIPLRELIRLAHGLHPSQVIGGPDWMHSARYDITAQADSAQPPTPAMLQQLLADRFELVTRKGVVVMPMFALVTVGADKSLGPQLRVSQVDCASVLAAERAPASPFPQPGERQLCDHFVGFAPRFEAGGVTMAQLATSLSRQVGRIVKDRTGLSGLFDLELQWTPALPQQPDGFYRLNGVRVDPAGPSIGTALEEQLGLRLEPTDDVAEVLIIDSVTDPTPD